jgi:hypothetical protein
MASAICFISPVQRQPLAAADLAAPSDRPGRSGWDMAHSESRTSSTSSARASARAVSSSAAAPLVQAAYAIFTADAAPTRSRSTMRASTAVPSNSRRTRAARGPER